MGKLCLIYNTAPRYRAAVFRAIDAEYDCDWYFGVTKSDIKEMDTSLLRNVKYYKPLGNPNKLYWKRGVLKLLFKKEYQNFFMLAEVRSITDWLFFWLASKFSPIRESIYRHMVGNGKKTGIDAKMKLWLYRNVTGTFVYGDRAKKHLIEKGINENSLSLDERAESKQYNSYLCDLLSSDDKYWSYLNGELKKLWSEYKLYLLRGLGALAPTTNIHVLSHAAYGFSKGPDISMMLNNFQCESHKWAIERMLQMQCKKYSK